jgi:outer membrane protein OmpA-like peptidoglycan-associated protein
MLVNLDRVLQNSLSPMAWRWRIEAIRTGKPFAEIVLLHSLQYRVEQVFLVHRDTSLLIRDVRAPSATQKDPDEVSAMLAAIQDFVRDSFQSEAGAEASTVRVGDISLYVEHGPLAFLAAAIRGTPPLELRAHMRTVIESIHLSSYALLRGYQGHAAGFESCTGLLETCLQFRLQSHEKSRKPVFAYTFVLIVALVLGIGVGLLVTENMRWKRYVAALRTHPGIVVTSDDAGLYNHSISGMRDPLAADPSRYMRESKIDPDRVKAIWHPYVSAAPELVLLRARTRLEPPAAVVLAVSGGTLRASGVAPLAWRSKAVTLATSIPGIEQFDARALEAVELQELKRQVSVLQDAFVLFGVGSSSLSPDHNRILRDIVGTMQRITHLADAAAQSVVIRIIGHTDESGEAGENRALSAKRARSVLAFLVGKGFNPDHFAIEGVGASQPVRAGTAGNDGALNRRVTFQVTSIVASGNADQRQ